jgi:hypothetical protein
MNRRLPAIALTALAALVLGSCGKQGELERPAPLWGAKAKAEYEAQRRKAGEQREDAQRDGTSPIPQPLPGDAGQTSVPARTAPMPGAPPDPNASAPAGVLPHPYPRPQ